MQLRSTKATAPPLLLGAILLLSIAHASAFGAARVAGTRVSIDPPPGFAVEPQFPGFRNAETGATIMVTEIAGPIDRLLSGLTKSALAGRGMTLHETGATTAGDQEAQLLRVTQSAGKVVFEKWILAFGIATNSVFVVATYPESEAKALRETMKRAVLSTRWNLDADVGHFEGLPFHVNESAGLKISNRVSNLLILTEGGVEGTVAPADPLLVVGASVSEVVLSDLAAFSRTRLGQLEQVSDVKNLQERATTVDGLPAIEITADGADPKSAMPMRVYQLVVADGSRYFLAQGLVGTARAEEFVVQFREVAESIRRSR